MLRLVFSLLILSSCSMGTMKSGGDRTYSYRVQDEYGPEELKELAPEVVVTSRRDPIVGKLDHLFGQGQKPLKRVGIIVFETRLQPTLEGLAKKNEIYLSEAGKQIMTENMLRIWEESLKVLAPELDYVSTHKLKKSRALHEYGSSQDDYVNSLRSTLFPDDIFYVESGKKTTTVTTVNPRGMRDVSFLLVPATELMGGPKWSEHNKQFLNDVAKELNLDAALVVMSEVSWTAAHTDKHSGEFIPEELKVKLKTSTLVPLSRYHERLDQLKNSERPNVTLCYRAYESELKVPVTITVPQELKNFSTIEKELLTPLFKTYKDLSQMTIWRVSEDLKKTW